MRRLLATTLLIATAAAGCGSDEDKPSKARTAPARDATPAPSANEGCVAAEPAPATEPEGLQAPSDPLSRDKRHTLVLETSCGTIEIALDVRRAPRTTASVAALAEEGFYDGLVFHRVSTGADGEPFVIQAGDPLGTGNGGPGYSLTEEPPRALRYTRGVVAMAKTQIEDPGTSGSQFFIVTGRDSGLPPQYALVGRVANGLEAVDRIAAVETDPATERPAEPVVIRRALVRSR